MSLDFFDYLRAPEIERAVIELETRIRSAHPEVSALFVKPQSVQVAAEHLKRGAAWFVCRIPLPTARPAPSRLPTAELYGQSGARIEVEIALHALIGFLGLRRLRRRRHQFDADIWSPSGLPGKPRPRSLSF